MNSSGEMKSFKESFEDSWENELRKWAEILENLNDEDFQKIYEKVSGNPVFTEIVTASSALRTKLLGAII